MSKNQKRAAAGVAVIAGCWWLLSRPPGARLPGFYPYMGRAGGAGPGQTGSGGRGPGQ